MATTMRRLQRAKAKRGLIGRGASMIEFVILLPMLAFLLMFIIDMGTVILVNGTMQNAAYAAARSGAQVGGASYVGATNSFPCGMTSNNCAQGASAAALKAELGNVPGYGEAVSAPTLAITSGGRCAATGSGVANHSYVTVKLTYTQKLATPGLGRLMGMTGSTVDGDKWQLGVTGTSRCEVVR